MSSFEDTQSVKIESQVPGFQINDFNITCPTTGEICSAQESLVGMYVGNVTENSDLGISLHDRAIVTAKLAEYKVVGRFIGCNDATCSVREAMDASQKRTKAVDIIRNLRDLLK